MRYPPIAAATLLALSACIEPQRPKIEIPGETFAEYLPGGWLVSCSERYTSGTGEVRGLAQCAVSRSGFQITADRTGRKLDAPIRLNRNLCERYAKRHGVDGTPLNGLTLTRQVELLSSGKTYFKEYTNAWPDCGVYTRKVELEGFAAAYARFTQVATEHGY